MTSTILGSRGFIGRHLAASLRRKDKQLWLPDRDDPEIFKRPLGVVYYCIGITADFRSRPYDTVDAHVGVLKQVLERADFEQLIYLSSTRIYAGSTTAQETQLLSVATYRPDDLYNLSKMMGESLALSSGRNCRVVRLSNVLGYDMGATNFVGAILAEARKYGAVHFQTSLESEKDYLWVDDAVEGLSAISEKGRQPIYNLAGGKNVRHEVIANLLAAKGIKVTVAEDAVVTRFPPISIKKMLSDTGLLPSLVEPKLAQLIKTLI